MAIESMPVERGLVIAAYSVETVAEQVAAEEQNKPLLLELAEVARLLRRLRKLAPQLEPLLGPVCPTHCKITDNKPKKPEPERKQRRSPSAWPRRT